MSQRYLHVNCCVHYYVLHMLDTYELRGTDITQAREITPTMLPL